MPLEKPYAEQMPAVKIPLIGFGGEPLLPDEYLETDAVAVLRHPVLRPDVFGHGENSFFLPYIYPL